jgi:outer membrane beta-barrel protein
MHPSRIRGFLKVSVGFILAMLVSLPFRAPAQEDDLDQGKVFAIQARDYRMNHEFSLSMAFLPLDAFYKFFAVSGHYVVHFNDLWAWEAIHFAFSQYLDVDTGLKSELSDKWDASATDTPRIDYSFDTNLMLKPLYGKMTLFDSLIVYMETYFVLGVGAEKFETAWFPAGNVGVGMRIFLSDTLSLRFEVREYVYLEEGGVDSTLYFGVGFCYNAFAEERKVKKEEKGVKE